MPRDDRDDRKDDDLDKDDAKRLLEDDDDQDDEPDNDDDKSDRDQDRRKRPTDRDDDDDDRGDPSKLGDAGKKALDAMKRDRNSARKELADARKKIKEFEDKDKTETQRLQEAHEDATGRAAKAEARSKALSVAIDRAPEHASLAQVRAVAKRVRGDDDDELEQDADELFELLAPAPKEPDRRVPGKPRQRLRGGSDPEDEPEEDDPRALAKSIRGG